MELCFKLLAGLLLLIQACHPTLLQNSTDSPGRTIDSGWLRELAHNGPIPIEGGPIVRDQEVEDVMNGLAMGSMILSSGEEEVNEERNLNRTYDGVTITTTSWLPDETHTGDNTSSAPALPNTEATTQQSPKPGTNNASDTPTGQIMNSTMVPWNYTDQMSLNSSASPKSSNATDLEEANLAPETTETTETTETPEPDLESTDKTTSSRPNVSTSTAVPESSAAPITPLPPNKTTESASPGKTEDETVPVTMTTVVPATTEGSNLTDKDGASGGGTIERGVASSSESNKRKEAWAAILGTAVAVCVVALVAYVILKKKNQKDFSHRKLVEFSSDPVLRLDNTEPLDLTYGRGAYYNPTLQTDNFQMTSMPTQYNH